MEIGQGVFLVNKATDVMLAVTRTSGTEKLDCAVLDLNIFNFAFSTSQCDVVLLKSGESDKEMLT
jgi:hypothetical protein